MFKILQFQSFLKAKRMKFEITASAKRNLCTVELRSVEQATMAQGQEEWHFSLWR